MNVSQTVSLRWNTNEHWQLHIENESKTKLKDNVLWQSRTDNSWLKDIQWNDDLFKIEFILLRKGANHHGTKTVINLWTERFLAVTLGSMILGCAMIRIETQRTFQRCWPKFWLRILRSSRKALLFSMRALCLRIRNQGSTSLKTSSQRVFLWFRMRSQNLGQANKSAGWMPWH